MDRIITRLGTLRAKLTQILQARDDAIVKHAAVVKKFESDLRAATEKVARELEEKQEAQRAESVRQRTEADQHWARRAAAVRTAVNKKKFGIEKQITDRKAEWAERRKESQAEAVLEHKQKLIELDAQHARNLDTLENIGKDGLALRDAIKRFAYDRGVRIPKDIEPQIVTDGVPDGSPEVPDEKPERLEARLDELSDTLAKSQRLGPVIPPIAAYVLVLTIHGIGAAAVYQYMSPHVSNVGPYLIGVGASCGIFLWIAHALCMSAKNKVRNASLDMLNDAVDLVSAVYREKSREKSRNMSEITQLGCQRVLEDSAEGEKFATKMAEYNKPLADAVARVQNQCDRLLQKISSRKGAALHAREISSSHGAAALRAQYESLAAKTKEDGAAAIATADAEKGAVIDALAASWRAELSDFDKFVRDSHSQFATSHPTWKNANVKALRLPDDYSKEVPIGELNLDLKAVAPRCDQTGPFSLESVAALTLPMFLSFPLHGSLLVTAVGVRRNDTLGLVFNTVLNLLRSFPPAKAKLTIIDPVGLGQNFAGLMHLADYDETLVNGRIWSDGAHIERKLTELTEHMEKVIQKYLRNRYKSIDEYNREAGQLAEPYRFVVIGDFPTGFSELALERLASIIKSGVRCGVYTIILHNERTKLGIL